MHWEAIGIITGAVINMGVLIGGLLKLSQIASHVQRTFDYFSLEHEILIQDYCERKAITIGELPTRLERAPWWGMAKAKP